MKRRKNKINEKQLQEIEDGTPTGTVLELINEVRRLQAVVAVYADHKNWGGASLSYIKDSWRYLEHGYAIAENALKDGE